MKLDEARILAYIKGELSADDNRRCDELIQSSPKFAEGVRKLQHIYDLSKKLSGSRKNYRRNVGME